MIVLKPYQNRVLGSLRDFLRACSSGTALHTAFHDILAANEFPEVTYFPVIAEGLGSAMPYVCLRVPTGGGKTLLACHAAGIAKSELLRAERAVVLWLVPSQTIHSQTADALRDPRHPYRLALETACAGPVEVLTIEEALTLRADLEKLALTKAQATGEYLRPILLIQAERVDDCTELRERLTADFGVRKEQVKIATGKLDELPSVDETKSPKCPVRIIITVPLDKHEEDALAGCAVTLEARAKIKQAVEAVREAERVFGGGKPRQPTPYELRQDFIVPLLADTMVSAFTRRVRW